MPKIYFEELYPELACPKPQPAYKNLPKWWKDMPKYDGFDELLPKSDGKKMTIRSCPAVEDSLFIGYNLCLPSDVRIDSTQEEIHFWIPNGFIKEKMNVSDYIQKHPLYLTDGYLDDEYYHPQSMKWNPLWGIKTEKGYSTFFMHPLHRSDLPFHTVSAIVDTDVFPTRNPYSFFVKRGWSGIIKRGTPILTIFPFKREDWESNIIEFDSLEYKRNLSQIGSVFTQAYKKIFWHRKKFI